MPNALLVNNETYIFGTVAVFELGVRLIWDVNAFVLVVNAGVGEELFLSIKKRNSTGFVVFFILFKPFSPINGYFLMAFITYSYTISNIPF